MQTGQTSFLDEEEAVTNINKLNVVELSFINGHSMGWQELFSGYDTLYAITYSSGLSFISKLLKYFKYGEIVFGNEHVMSYSVSEVMAFQTSVLKRIRSTNAKDFLISRINDCSLKFYIARNKLSHEKIYLLSSESGAKRVVLGSANMSEQAFSGRQRENISYIDGEEAYDWYFDVYNSLKIQSTDEVSERAILLGDDIDNLDELPISNTVKVNKVLKIIPDKSSDDEIKFALDIKNIAKRLKPLEPKADKSGYILLSPTTIVTMKGHSKDEDERKKEARKEYPELVIDIYNKNVYLNDIALDLLPSKDLIKNDVDYFMQYLDGYKIFHGEYEYMQKRYFEFANWFFCSPFMAVMRDMANRYNRNTLPYPIFGLLYGQSKAGKTSFLETLLKMMIGQKTKISAPEFTRKTIDGLRYQVKGAPIIVDDLTQNRFTQHAIETIKNDSFGMAEQMTHYPAVVISANEDVKAVSPEIIRRTVICRVGAGLTNTEVMQSNVVRKVQKNIGTAFYREYLRRMLDSIPSMVEEMKDDNVDSCPDILKKSSETIVNIIKEYCETDLPEYFRCLTLDDYFSEKVTGKYAIQIIKAAWKTSRKCFIISKSINELRYNAGTNYDADRIIKELPETLEARKSREWVIMNLQNAKMFFEEDFNASFFSKLFGK